MSLQIEVQATIHKWDAPFQQYGYPDGSTHVRRDHGYPPPGWISCTSIPHAVVLVNGEMSEFDHKNQPQ